MLAARLGYEFWIIGVPRRDLEITTISNRCRSFLKSNISPLNFPPNFRPGTVDDLYGLSDDLIKMDSFVEAVTTKIARQLRDLVGESTKEEGDKNATLTVGAIKLESFMRAFEWNAAKYKTSTTLREIVESITQELTQLDEELRSTQQEYISVGHAIDAYERNRVGNLQIRDLSDIIKPEDVVDSEHLTTLFVIVPKHSEKDWESSYETLSQFVVPRSSKVITQDGETLLRSVVLFKTDVDEFKSKLVKKKWAVREYTSMNSADLEETSGKVEEQRDRRQKLQGDLTRWCKINFGEAFSAWVHLKTVRVFVESVLRFGLPRDYVFLVLEPENKREKQLRKVLEETFKSLASEHMVGDTGEIAIAGTQEQFYPYVFTGIIL